MFEHFLLVDGGTVKIVQHVVQLREECNFSRDAIREVRCISLVVNIGTAKTVALTI